MPGRPRKSTLQLLTQGTWRPDRHGGRSLSPTTPLGQPPTCLGPAERKAWREVAGWATWLRHPDRGLLEVYARLLVEQRTAFADMNAARLTLLVTLGARLGLAPIDRTRLEPKPEPKPHRF